MANYRNWKRFESAEEFQAFITRFRPVIMAGPLYARAMEVLRGGTSIEYSEHPRQGDANPKIRYTEVSK